MKLKNMIRTFNIHGPKIKIWTSRPYYRQTEEITGQVRITAPEYPISGRAVIIELVEYWRRLSSEACETYETVHRTVNSVVLAGRFTFAPRSVHTFTFHIRLPRNCRLSIDDNAMRLVATLDIPKRFNPAKSRELTVLPAREFMAIAHTVTKCMGFREYRLGRSYHEPFSHFRFWAPSPMLGRIRYLGLNMEVDRQFGVDGELLIRPREKDWQDRLREILFEKRVIRKPFALKPSQLFLPDGFPNEKAIVETLGMLIW